MTQDDYEFVMNRLRAAISAVESKTIICRTLCDIDAYCMGDVNLDGAIRSTRNILERLEAARAHRQTFIKAQADAA